MSAVLFVVLERDIPAIDNSLVGEVLGSIEPRLRGLCRQLGVRELSVFISEDPDSAAERYEEDFDSLAEIGGTLQIEYNTYLADMTGLFSLDSVGGELNVFFNDSLPDCEVCDLLEQITDGPTATQAHDNIDDECTPVPDNCP